MPELPEVETATRDLAPHLIGRKLENPVLHKTDVLRNTTPRRVLAALRGQEIVAVWRRAKHAVFDLADGRRMVIQPRMTGVLMVQRTAEIEKRYAVLEGRIGRGSSFVYRDVRRLGTLWLLTPDEWTAYESRIGPEPLASQFGVDEFAARLGNTGIAIKKALMDQRRVAGVGNIYANEALFRAGINPRRPARRLKAGQWTDLYRETRAVLQEAIDSRGTTFRDYRTGTGSEGGFQLALRVYGRGGEPCVNCETTLKTTHEIDGRATTYCWRCQGRR